MVRNRSWPAVSHYLIYKRKDIGVDEIAYNLKLHGFAIQFDCPNFLPSDVSNKGIRWRGVNRGRSYKVHPNSRNIALSVCVIGKS